MKNKQIKLIKIETIRFSPEFEFEVSSARLSEKLIERSRTLQGWKIHEDCSLDHGIELSPENTNHLFYNEDSLLQIKEVLALCRVYHAKALKTCGLHFHINAKSLSDKDIVKIITEWVHRQEYVVKRFRVSKDRLENTCKLIPKKELKLITEKNIHKFRNSGVLYRGEENLFEDKYRSLNISHLPKDSYQSIEFRSFESTVNFKEIKSIIYWLLCFIRDSLERN